MNCPRCHHENEAGARFCEACAAPLARVCTACGHQLSPTARFCPSCAHPTGSAPAAPAAGRFASPEAYTPQHLAARILTSRAALEGERKQVTVLFADLKGSMQMLADRDPEEARSLLDPVLERMMEVVHRYEGTVNQVMGDGIMALFGAPVAHEDHAVRACYAALDMQAAIRRYADEVWRSHGIKPQIRVGLNSGEVVVRAIGSDLRMDYTAVGQTTHLAARMEQLADPGASLVTAETLRLAEGFVAVTPLGPVPIRGLPAPVEVYALTGAGPLRSRLHVAAARGLTRFVGREGELEQLRQALGQAGARQGQVVALVGEPGVGKSRLVWEVTHSHLADHCKILEASTVSYGRATAYAPVIQLLKRHFAVKDHDGPPAVRKKVMDKLLTLDRALEGHLPALLTLLDAPPDDPHWQALDPPQRRRCTLDAVKRLLLREGQAHPLLVVVEDLHWIDAETQAVLDHLVESLPGARVLLLVTYRPEYRHDWGGKAYYRQLDPLAPDSASELLETLLGSDAGLGPLKQLLITRTEGNPFFLEESVRSLVEDGMLAGERGAHRLARPSESVRVPPTVQAVLAARLDRLPAEDKELLQTASVVGTAVPTAVLAAVSGVPAETLASGLARLQAAEFLYETSLFPDLEYTFKHALTHEVAYKSLLQERRRVLHARVLEAMERLDLDRLGKQVERLAHHAVRGGLPAKAAHYHRQAGLKAFARSALPDARDRFEQALDALKALPESAPTLEQAFEIRLELRPVLSQLGDVREALKRLDEAEGLAERLDDDHRRGRVCAFKSNIQAQLGELDDAIATGTRALEAAARLGELGLRILARNYLAQSHYLRGDYQRVVELAADNLAALPAEWADKSFGIAAPASVYARFWLVMSLAQLGRFDEAAEPSAEAIQIAEWTQRAFPAGLAHWASSTRCLLQGDWAKARTIIAQWLGGLAVDIAIQRVSAIAAAAWALAQLGDTTEALGRLREAEGLLERMAAQGFLYQRGWDYVSLGRACLVIDQPREAQRLGDRAVEASRRHAGFAAHARHLLGDVATHPDRFDAQRGEDHYRQALALAGARGMRPLVAHCHLGLGQLYVRTGRRDGAQGYLATAATLYREMGMSFYLAQAEAAVAEAER